MKQWGLGGISDQPAMEKVCLVQSGSLIWLNAQLLFADPAKYGGQRVEIVHKGGSAGAAEGWAAPWWVPTQAQATPKKSLGILDLFKQERVDKGIETDGSNLSGVSAKCAWDDLSRPPEDDEDSRSICIGTQPRRLSGKGKRSWAKLLSWPFSFCSGGSGQCTESCSIFESMTNTIAIGRLGVSQGSKMDFGVASLRKAGERKRDLGIVLSKCFFQFLGKL